ncbi:MAG: hypothetical protein MUC91_14115 [Verrucomicrobia bacterium]|nr:hypothetical protein [Verrucomicrobiota bacterium]
MTLFAICEKGNAKGLSALLIGGHAVTAHGHPRNTFDRDSLVPRSSFKEWRAFVLSEGYSIHQEGGAFVQFKSPDETVPLDLMVVSDDAYRKFEAEAQPNLAANARVKVVALKHLLALKSHAIRHGHPGRVEKDVDDVIGHARLVWG